MAIRWLQKLGPFRGRPSVDRREMRSERDLLQELESALGSRLHEGRGSLARAAAWSRSGRRAVVELAAGEVFEEGASLQAIADEGLPLVLHLVPGAEESRRLNLQGGLGLDSLKAAGWLVLQPTTPDELLPLALLSRRLSEALLRPVALLREFTHDGAGLFPVPLPGVGLPSLEDLLAYAGNPADRIECPLPWQQALYGRNRRRLPRVLDPAQPRAARVRPGLESAGHASQMKSLREEGQADWLREECRRFDELLGLGLFQAPPSGGPLVAHGRLAGWLSEVLPVVPALKGSTLYAPRLLHPLLDPLPVEARLLASGDSLAGQALQLPAAGEGLQIETLLAGLEKAQALPSLRIRRDSARSPRDEVRSQELGDLFPLPATVGGKEGGASVFGKAELPQSPALVLVSADAARAAQAAARLCALLDGLEGARSCAMRVHPGQHDRGLSAWRIQLKRAGDRPEIHGETRNDLLCTLDARSARELPERLLCEGQGLLQVLPPRAVPAGRVAEHAVSPATADFPGPLWLALAPAGESSEALDRLCGSLAAALLVHTGLEAGASLQQLKRENPHWKEGVDSLRALSRELLPPRSPSTLEAEAHAGLLRRLPRQEAPIDDPHRMAAHSTLNEAWDGVCDPAAFSGRLPARSGRLRREERRPDLPWLDAEGCGDLSHAWTVCPEGALPLKRLTPAEVLDALLAWAAGRGEETRRLSMKSRSLAAAFAKALATTPGADGARVLHELLEAELAKDEELRAEVRVIQEALSGLPLIHQPGQAACLLALGVDADACKGCGLCAQAVDSSGLGMRNWEEVREEAGLRWSRWQLLPATAEGLPGVEEGQQHPERLLFDTEAAEAFGPGDDSPAGNTARSAIRLFAGMASAMGRQQQPALLARVTTAIGALEEQLARRLSIGGDKAARLKELLAGGEGELELSELGRQLAPEGTLLDREELGALAGTLEELKAWQAELELAPATIQLGLGLPGHRVEARWPWNPAAVPLMQLGAEGADEALGQLQAMGEDWAEKQRLLQAAAALAKGRMPRRQGSAGLPTDWQGAPRLLLGVDAAAFREGRLGAWRDLLSSGAPVKLLVICDIGDPDAHALASLAGGGLFAFSGSHGDPAHLRQGFQRALAAPGPALCTIYCSRLPLVAGDLGGSAAGLRMARLALDHGLWPHYVYDPALSTEEAGRFVIHEGTGAAEQAPEGFAWEGALNAAVMRAMEGPFAEGFPPLDEREVPDDLEQVPLEEALELDEEELAEALPFIEARSPACAAGRRLVAPRELALCRAVMQRMKRLDAMARRDLVWPDEEALRKEGARQREDELLGALSAGLVELGAPLSESERALLEDAKGGETR